MSETTSPSRIVIVGAGELRKQGYTGAVTLVGEEEQIPYKRPPLSKGFLAGSVTEDSLYVSPRAKLDSLGIEFLGSSRVTGIVRSRKTVRLADGRELAYDKLALTTGGRARGLSLPGAERANLLPLRSSADLRKLEPHCVAGQRAVVIGGGFIGLETPAAWSISCAPS